MLTRGIAECGGQVSFAEANQTQENNVGFLFDKTKPEEVLDLEPIDFFGPVPTEAFQGLDDWKTGGFDPPSNRALLTGRYFALKEPTQVVEMTPVVGGAFDSQGLAVFFDTSQLEVIKVLIEQEVGRISSHGLGTMGMVSLAFVDGEIGLLEFDLEQILAPGEVERTGLRAEALALLEDVSDIVAAEGLELEGVFDGASDFVTAMNLT